MKRPLKNIGSFFIGDAGSRIIGFLITIYLARVLAPSAFGVINIGLAVLGYLALAGSPGIQVLETRNVATRVGGMAEHVGAVLSLRLLLSTLLFAATAGAVALFVEQVGTRLVIILYALSLFPYALLIDWFFQGKEEFPLVSGSRVLNYILYGVGAVILVRSQGDVWLTPVAFLAGNAGGAMLLILMYRRQYGNVKLLWQPVLWRDILRQNLPVGLAMFLSQSVSNLPPLVIGFILGTREVGMYSAAMKFIFLLLLIDRLFNALFLPAVTRYFTTRAEEVPFLLSVTVKLVLFLILPVLVIAVVVSPDAIALVFGPGYDEASPLLKVLMGYVLLTLLNSVFVCTLIGAGLERRFSRAITIGTVILAASVVGLTSVFGAIGGAAGVLIGEASTLAIMIVEVARVTHLPSLNGILRLLIAAAAMAGTIALLADVDRPLAIVASIMVFVLVVAVAGGIRKEEFRYLRERVV